MLTKNIFRKSVIAILIAACLLQSSSVFAWGGRGYGHGGGYGRGGWGWGWGAAVGLIGTAALLDAAYRYPPYYYVNGMPYYGTPYYAPAPVSYVVAQQPVMVAPAANVPGAVQAPAPVAAPVQQAVASNINDSSFDVHIPNDNGSFTLVTLRQTEKGFLGPQGEFYADHPAIEELKKRYVKK